MALPVIFANLTAPTLPELDQNFNALGALVPIPCTISGTNALALTLASDTPAVAALVQGMQFTGIAAATNATAVTAAIGALSPIAVYKDSPAGPVALTGGEIVGNNQIVLIYDAALNTGAGGFHLMAAGASILLGQTITAYALIIGQTLSPATLTRVFSRAATIGFTVVPANTGQSSTFTLPGAAIGDHVLVQAPTLTSGMLYNGVVTANGTLSIQAVNATAASLTPPAGTYRITAMGYA